MIVNRTCLSVVERAESSVSIDNIGWVAKGLNVEPWRLPGRLRKALARRLTNWGVVLTPCLPSSVLR